MKTARRLQCPAANFPLPPNYFDTQALDATTHDTILHIARTCSAQLVDTVHAMDDLLVYAMHTDAASQRRMKLVLGKDGYDASLACMAGHMQFHAPLVAVASFFRAECLSRAANDGLVVDGQTLYTLAAPTLDAPLQYTTIKWVAHKLPSGRHRDYCYLESHRAFIDPKSSRRGWLRVLHSLDVPACPPLPSSSGVKRSKWFRSGHVLLENAGSGLLDCYAMLTVPTDLAPTAHEHHSMSFMRSWVTQVMAVPNVLLTRRLATKSLVPTDALRPKDSVKSCMLCTARFRLFSSKHHCRACGHIVCSKCHITWTMATLRICLRCADSNTTKSCACDSFLMTHGRSTVASCGRHRDGELSTLSNSDVLEPASCPEPMPRESSDLTKSRSSARLGALSIEPSCPRVPINYDHVFDMSVLQQPPPTQDSAASHRIVDKPELSIPLSRSEDDRSSFSEAIVDVDALLLKSRRRAHSSLELPSTHADNVVALHDLLEQLYDGKSDAVQSVYRDLVA
ncbi:hypothetical protein H310_04341 [Aphanomyces invadans]|uniref:FYVE-type domain-containing protein n=1 Tax=Aphanomyces invadans TaxID=157072 RepID=A0A024UEA2_9STRA|nr:hypothetical protein H310_04341 [Aphanomyces invadans]ETW03923.1 hypothetical protein H310_04341 [Aphanomyces invadans]|eukprot:XP_008866879.1 hypothetical protein H310_04341 [Aphanomyces invadans]